MIPNEIEYLFTLAIWKASFDKCSTSLLLIFILVGWDFSYSNVGIVVYSLCESFSLISIAKFCGLYFQSLNGIFAKIKMSSNFNRSNLSIILCMICMANALCVCFFLSIFKSSKFVKICILF